MATKKQENVKETKKKTNKKEVETKNERPELQEKNNIVSLFELLAIIVAVIVILVFFPGSTIWNIVILLLMLSLLIFVHELGHFIMAKLFGVHVYEFAIGMGPMVFSFRRKNDPTLYSLRALPIGGFNSIAGESYDDDDKLDKNQKMCYKPKWQRLLILVAGVTMNFITAFILLFCIGLTGTPEQNNVVSAVKEGTPAAQAGIKAGDKIIKLNGHRINDWNYLSVVSVLKNDSNKYNYVVKHQDGSIQTIEITPLDAIEDINGNLYYITEENTEEKVVQEHNLKQNEYAKTKISVYGESEVKYGVINALKYAARRSYTIVKSMLLIIGSLFTGKISLDSLAGPVGMYSVVKQASAIGFINIVYLTAYLSINLAVMNILPFPAFDGGHVLFILIELITGKRVNEKVEGVCHFIGFIIIFALMILITFKDILRLFG